MPSPLNSRKARYVHQCDKVMGIAAPHVDAAGEALFVLLQLVAAFGPAHRATIVADQRDRTSFATTASHGGLATTC
jgi:hypothetical protein